mmetsp:Transcript_52327/g.147326  ORF Transcript_52327/g.147326 Transcript_52327/m.147326 type:complete len:318 (+) Transcript_52327:2112-3065(+)
MELPLLVHLEEGVRQLAQLVHQAPRSVVAARWREAVLDQDGFALVHRVQRQEPFEGAELQYEAAEGVASVHAREDPLPFEKALDLGDLVRNTAALNDLFPVDVRIAEVGNLRHDLSAIVVHAYEAARTECWIKPVNSLASDKKVPGVGEKLKTQKIGAQHSREQLFPNGQGLESVRRREGRVQVQPNVGLVELPRDEGRCHQQMVVVDPDEIRLVSVGHNCVGIYIVDVLVRGPTLFIEGARVCSPEEEHDVVEDRPQIRGAKFYELVELLCGGEHRDAFVLLQLTLQLAPLPRVLHVNSWPADAHYVIVLLGLQLV